MKNRIFHSILVCISMLLIIGGMGCDTPSNPVTSPANTENATGVDEYRTRQDEISPVNLATLMEIYSQVSTSDSSLTQEQIREEIFNQLKALKDSGSNTDEVPAGPTIYGKRLTWAEFWLLFVYPELIPLTSNASDDATAEAKKQWSGSQYQTKADAFRHAYWNILLSARIRKHPLFFFLPWAEMYTNAHESETPPGLDKDMDLHNNAVGRSLYNSNKQLSESAFSTKLKNWTYKKVTTTSPKPWPSNLVYIR
jgi:hypothetical protein